MFFINAASGVPIYEQLIHNVAQLTETGVLKPDDRLPSVRRLATDLGVNPNTVAKAYAHLEKEGYICALPKKGAYVTYVPGKKTEDGEATDETEDTRTQSGLTAETVTANDTATLLCRNSIIAMKDSGITRETLLKLIEEVYKND